MNRTIADERAQFELLISKLISRATKKFNGKGPESTSVLIRKHYLIIEMKGYLNPMQQSLVDGNMELIEEIERVVQEKIAPVFEEWVRKWADIKVIGQGITVIADCNTKIIMIVADMPWEEAVLRVPIESIDVEHELERLQKRVHDLGCTFSSRQ